MNCVHGLPMEMSCADCIVEYDTRRMHGNCHLVSDGTNARQVEIIDTEAKYVEALAKLTRSIDGLRGSVDKLTESMDGDVPVITMTREEANEAMNRQRSAMVEALAVKHGPITEAEIAEGVSMYTVKIDTKRGFIIAVLSSFAASRGLL